MAMKFFLSGANVLLICTRTLNEKGQKAVYAYQNMLPQISLKLIYSEHSAIQAN